MRIFLTGPTGYIGGAVLDALVRAGHAVTGLVRDTPRARRLARRGVEAVVGQLGEPTWRDAAIGFDAYIHTGYEASPRAADVDRAALDTLISAAKLTGGSPRLIYTSGVWVLGPAPGGADETAPLNAAAVSSWRAPHEQVVLAQTGVRTAVVRPGVVYGASRGIVGDMFRDAVNGLMRVVGTGENHWPLIYHRDLADLYARLAAVPDALSFAPG